MSKLNILGTPIGNIEDITIRGMRAVFEGDIILAEDTRQFGKLKGILKEKYSELFEKLQITENPKQRVYSYREQNHQRVIQSILERLSEGLSVVLTTDAGMPGISDPGYLLIHDVIESGYEVDVFPGPTSVTSALVLSGLPTDRYTFIGFPPRKSSKAKKLIEQYLNDDNTVVFFESPFRILKTLEQLQKDFETVQVAAVNDITKKFQTVIRGDIEEVLQRLKEMKVQGEWVVCLRR